VNNLPRLRPRNSKYVTSIVEATGQEWDWTMASATVPQSRKHKGAMFCGAGVSPAVLLAGQAPTLQTSPDCQN
jgi:hypothetical protein